MSYAVVLILLNLAVGVIIAILSTRYSKKKTKSDEDYFTSGRNIPTALMVATFIAYAVGTGLLFSPAEAAYQSGFTAMIGYALAISLAYIVFIPVSKAIREKIPNGHTIGEYTELRYGRFMNLVTVITTTIYMFILFVSNLTGAALAFKYIGGVPMLVSVLVVGIPTVYFATSGGVNAALFSNGLQSILITPFLIIPAIFALVHYGGAGKIYDSVLAAKPEFLEILNIPGLEFAVMIIIAVCAAELLNQTLWQRIYVAKDHKTVSRSLLYAALMILPMTIIAAVFGLAVVGTGSEVPHTSIAGAIFIDETVPKWVTTIFLVVIMLGASSTGGDALSGFSSIFSIDIIKPLMPGLDSAKSVKTAKIGALLLGIAGMAVAYLAPSILFLLLLADLLASSAVIPVISGLYSSKVTGIAAGVATIAGIIAGLPMFIQGNSFRSFLTAILVSGAIILLSHLLSRSRYDFTRLKTDIKKI